ncbi:methyl-accepting chemotaxis protein [Myxococcota bacterium]|nr:methyl-accepting chemotaxis protein [Myxococcota bacterium]
MSTLQKMTLTAKLASAFSVMTLLAALIGGVAFWKLDEVGEHSKDVAQRELPGTLNAARLEALVHTAERDLCSMLSAPAEEQAELVASYRASIGAIEKRLADAPSFADTEEARTRAEETSRAFADWREHSGHVVAAVGRNREEARAMLSSAEDEAVAERFDVAIDRMIETAERESALATAEVDEAEAEMQRMLLVTLAVIIVLGVVIAVSLTRHIRSRLAQIGERAEQLRAQCITELRNGLDALARGDLDVKVEATTQPLQAEEKDEIGALAETIDGVIIQTRSSVEAFDASRRTIRELVAETAKLAEAGREGALSKRSKADEFEGSYRTVLQGLNETIDAFMGPIEEATRVLERVAQRDFTQDVRGEYRGDHARVKRALNTAVAEIRSALASITKSSDSLATSSDRLAQVSAEIGAGATQSSAQAGTVSAAAEQVSKSIQTVATATEEMRASVAEIAKSAADASHIASTAVGAARSTNEIVTKLGSSSAEIGEIIKVITAIAQQTNLLALNATIEAARAGEAGKGFAVVATEVKELAKQTADASENIGRRIAAIQTDSRAAVEAISEISTVIGRIDEIQSTIAAAVEEQTATSTEIGRSVTEAAAASADIARNIGEVARASTASAASAQQGSSESQGLADLAGELRLLVKQFRWSADDVAHPALLGGRADRPAARA